MQAYEQEHLDRIRGGLAECTVLLKKDGAFPLSSPCRIAAVGNGVRHTVKGGTGSGEVNSRSFVTVEQGLTDAGFTLTSKSWLDAYDGIRAQAQAEFVKELRAAARANPGKAMLSTMGAILSEPEYDLPLPTEGDCAVYVLSRICGEGSDRSVTAGDFLLTETEREDILTLNERFEKFMLVLNVGAQVDLEPVKDVKNILLLSELGVETGRTLADLLLGNAYPGGKLADTWGSLGDYPDVGDFGTLNDTYYKEGIYVGYRWFDAAGKTPLFPFGFGLGYTDFKVGEASVSLTGTKVTVTASVKNTGGRPGRETLQVYLSAPEGELDQPVRQLAAFKKSKELSPGEEESLSVTFDMADQASYSESREAYLLEEGDYVVAAGTSSRELQDAAVLHLPETVLVKQVKNLFGDPGFTDWKPERTARHPDPRLPELDLQPEDFPEETVDYDGQDEVCEEVKELTYEELCRLGVGLFDPLGSIASVIGSAGRTVAGAAGETHAAPDLPGLVLADGPAGVRISPRYYVDKKGEAHGEEAPLPESFLELLPKGTQAVLDAGSRPGKDTVWLEQYCTAIPTGAALAQSWDPAYVTLCGDVVGEEMERFGIDLWLAPALNIHRSPLCGRNFEYYSEDPCLAGIMAAAITDGVQSHPGRGVTVKHFAANNQETNRNYNNSRVSERALREIYLKGFALCIRLAHPQALMTSYNLINGTHTSESRALCTDFLRREVHFTGLCMTDWVISAMGPTEDCVYKAPDPAMVAAAGGDLFMPGSRTDYDLMKAGVEEGRLSARQLQVNASRLYKREKEKKDLAEKKA